MTVPPRHSMAKVHIAALCMTSRKLRDPVLNKTIGKVTGRVPRQTPAKPYTAP